MRIPILDRWQKRDVLGIDWGTVGTKIVRFHGDTPSSLEHWFFPAGENSEQELVTFRDFLQANHLSGLAAACNIEDASLRIRRLELPKMPDYDLREAVRWEMRDALEGDLADYIVRYSVMDEYFVGEVKKLSLLAFAIRKEVVLRRRDFLKRLSLDPVLIEPTPVSLLVAFDRIHGWEEGKFYGVVDLGESHTHFVVLGQGRLYFFRPLTGLSGREIRLQMQKEIGLSEEDLSEVWRHLLGGHPPEGRLSSLGGQIEVVLSGLSMQLSLEIQGSMDAFSLSYRKEKIDQLWLCGGQATLMGLAESLTKNLGVPAALLDPRVKFALEGERPHVFDVALGLALFH